MVLNKLSPPAEKGPVEKETSTMSIRSAKFAFLVSIGGLVASSPGLLASPQEAIPDPERQFERFKRRYDTDFDGRIARSEYPRSKRAFNRRDMDGDGYLTLADFIPIPVAEPIAKPTPKPRIDSQEQEHFFETRIRPVLAKSCYECHSEDAKRIRGGLKVDSLAALLEGGASGPALLVGDPDKSELINAIRYTDPDFAMPPDSPLDPQEVADLEYWVQQGAYWPEGPSLVQETLAADSGYGIDLEAGRQFWSFQPIERPTPPSPKDSDWSRGPIDQFLRMSMETAGLDPVGDANDRTWLRRVTLDLSGLPPTPEEIAAFEADKSKDRDARVVDRLLASYAYAERWGQHWLDVARYAESSGREANVIYPHAWRYRDWVLRAFDEDMPYDRFLAKQIAGDLESAEDLDEQAWNQIATGYLAIGSKGHGSRDDRNFRLDLADEQIDAFSQGMLGLTISCARCHDHKFDPIPLSLIHI